jgi:hypothetical protein
MYLGKSKMDRDALFWGQKTQYWIILNILLLNVMLGINQIETCTYVPQTHVHFVKASFHTNIHQQQNWSINLYRQTPYKQEEWTY